MATGASTADLAILLVDARHGVLEQSRRHARIGRLLGISQFVVAVNKMDLVGFDRGVFDAICGDLAEPLRGATVQPIPISALMGDNVTVRSDRTPWYEGPSLLSHLEAVDMDDDVTAKPFRLPVQLVLRPDHEFRGYAGQIQSGMIHRGETVTIWPGGRTTTVTRIVTYDGDLEMAFAPMSVTLVLADDVDVSRGDMLAVGPVHVGQRFDADIVWMDQRPLDPKRLYLLKHTTRVVPAEVDRTMALNEIGSAIVSTSKPLLFDHYQDNRATGSFILIDPATNFTAGAGMIENFRRDHSETDRGSAAERLAQLARGARSEADAVAAMRAALDELLS